MALMPPLVTVMVKAAEAAAKSLARDFGEVEHLQISLKGPSDFVSAADKKAEKTLHHFLQKARPDFGYFMEEGGKIEGNDKDRVFIIDPLDGTNNFLHAVPHWAINIAAYEEGEVTAGITYDLIRNEMFWTAKGMGAWLGNRRLRLSDRKTMEMALVACSLPAKGRRDPEASNRDIAKIQAAVSGVRATGSSALDLAYVAAGRFDAFWQREIAPWDVAPGVLLVREAGGTVTEVNGGKDPVWGRTVLAANGGVYQDMLGLLK